MEQNRFKSPVLWAAVVAQLVSISILAGIIDISLGDTVNAIAAGVLQLLVILGILNNPTDKKDF